MAWGDVTGDGVGGARTSQRRRLAYGFAMLLLLSLLCGPFFRDLIDRDAPQPARGAVTFEPGRDWRKPVVLGGDWGFAWRPGGGDRRWQAEGDLEVPGGWRDRAVGGRAIGGGGVGRYTLTVAGLPPGHYQLWVPRSYAAIEVAVDGVTLSRRGRMGESAADTGIQTRASYAIFDAGRPPVRIEITMASFLHRDDGIRDEPVLGRLDAMQEWSALSWAQEFLFHVSLVLLSIYGLTVFLFRREDRASLYFALACLFFQPTSAASGFDNLLLMAFPGIGFGTMLALIYLCGFVATGFFLAYATALFPAETPRRWVRLVYAGLAGFFVVEAAALIARDTLLASQVHSWAMGFTLIALFTVIWIVARACARRRDSAIMFLTGIVVFVAMISAEFIVSAFGVARDRVPGLDLAAFGVLIPLFSQIIVLAERWSVATAETRTSNADLRSLLELSSSVATDTQLARLLGRIAEVASRIVQAERISIFIHDPKSSELWTLVAQGDGIGQIKMPDSIGIAGAALAARETISVADAYDDPRFNAEIDAQSGFRTRALLAMPIVARDGRKLGIMEALNRVDGGSFGAADAERMAAFVAQAAVAIDNATLFSEVASSRKYNESILRSMSSGVVTLDPDAKVAKFNAAACAILRVSPEVLQGVDARVWLSETNPPLIAELDGVSATSDPKTMLDFDLVTGDGSHRSVNITIVPLVSEAEEIGLLILLEDISEGKRLRGAMRRFMPQEVVDEVLDRDDDKMFGTACHASVLFADIRDFTGMAEALSPRETVDMLNEIFTDLFEAVSDAGGVLDKYIGDAIMAVFGAPLSTGRDAINAVEAALKMQEMMAAINARRVTRGAGLLRIGIGIATGEVIAGTIGSPKRMDYTVIGDSVNLAARLEDATKTYQAGILICEATAAALSDDFILAEIDRMQVKGRQRLETIFEVRGKR